MLTAAGARSNELSEAKPDVGILDGVLVKFRGAVQGPVDYQVV